MILLCCFGTINASEDVIMNEAVSEFDSNDESIAVENDEIIESVDDSSNEPIAIQDEKNINDTNTKSLINTDNQNNEENLSNNNVENLLDWDLYNAPVYYYYFPSYAEWTVKSDEDIENFYIYAYDPMVLSFENGKYTTTIYLDMDSGTPGVVMYNAPYAIVGNGDNVIFACEGGYNINSGYVNPSEAMFEVQPQGQDGQTYKAYSIYAVVSHTNIIFDCDVTVGSKNFEFTNCTFKKSLTINSCDWDVDNTLKINATFKNCTFEFDKNQISSDAKVNLIFDDDCKFPVTTVDSNVLISNETNVIIVTLTDVEGNSIKGATVTYNTTSGVKDSNVTGDDGKFTISGLTGEFTIYVDYKGNESYNPSNDSASFNFKLPAVKTTITINSTEKGIITITVVDNENKPVKDLTVKYSINGTVNSTGTTNANGIINVTVSGEGNIKAEFEGNENYLKSNNTYEYNFTETQTLTDSKIIIKNESNIITITLTTTDNTPISGATLTYNTTNDIKGSNTTNDKGQITITDLTGEFTIDVDYKGNESYKPSNNSTSFNFKLPSIKTTLTINSTEKGIITITIVDNENKAIKDIPIKYNINNTDNQTKITDENGTIILPLIGEGIVKAYFEGNDNYLASEYSYEFNFTDHSSNGTSNNTTSSNQTSTNSGKTTSNTKQTTKPKVTKVASKIIAKKATFKVKVKTKKYTITLKANKAISKAKVTLKIGKKTYKATTNSKGKATFKITKLIKKGKYTATISYAGNNNYKSTSTKVKITIKK